MEAFAPHAFLSLVVLELHASIVKIAKVVGDQNVTAVCGNVCMIRWAFLRGEEICELKLTFEFNTCCY